jgi:hypothetical protein
MKDFRKTFAVLGYVERWVLFTLAVGLSAITLSAIPIAMSGVGLDYIRPGDVSNSREHAELFGAISRLETRISDLDRRVGSAEVNDREGFSNMRQTDRNTTQIAINTTRLDRIETFGIGVVLAAFGAAVGVGANALFTMRTYRMVKKVHDASVRDAGDND